MKKTDAPAAILNDPELKGDDMPKVENTWYRCPGTLPNGERCNRKFFRGKPGTIEIKCPRCKMINNFYSL